MSKKSEAHSRKERRRLAGRIVPLSAAALVCAVGCAKPGTDLDDDGMALPDQGKALKGSVVINELFPHGSDVLSDPDWVELKNIGDAAADLSGYRVRDDKTAASLPAGTQLPPGGYLILYCDDAKDGGASERIHLPFKLGSSDEFYLLLPDGNQVDAVTWDAASVPAGKAFGRLPDGHGSFGAVAPTRGSRNGV